MNGMNAFRSSLHVLLAGAGLAVLLAASFPVSAEVSLGGSLTLDWQAGLNSPGALEVPGTVLQLKATHDFAPAGAAVAVVEVANATDPLVTFREAYVDLYAGSTDLRLGRQRIAWGTTDGVNPTDNLNPVDYRRPFEEDNRREVAALRLKHYVKSLCLEAVWLPVFEPSPLPEPGDRWAPPTAPPALPEGLALSSLTVAPTAVPARTLANSEVGLRVATSVAGIDAALSYFSGWDDLPAVHAVLAPAGPGLVDLTLRPVHHRIQVVGLDWTSVRGKWGFRGEAAYFRTEDTDRVDPEIRNPYLQYVVGADYTPSDKWYLNAQVIGERVEDSATPAAREPGEGTKHAVSCAVRYTPDANTEFSLEGIYNLTDEDAIVKPTFKRSLADGVTLTTGLVLLSGRPDTRFGQFDRNDYGYVKLTLAF